MDDDEPMEMRILGRTIGTATGWDQSTDWGVCFYGPQFNDIGKHVFGIESAESVYIDFETGIWQTYNHFGSVSGEGNDLAYRFARAEMA
jgi:hypothetical protein